VFAVIAGLVFAIPWAGVIAATAAGDPAPTPALWHPLHTLAGAGFALALVELRFRYPGWFGPSSRIAVTLAIASAVAFALANGGEVLGLGQAFTVLYGISLIALSAAVIGVAVTTPTLPRPLPVLLIFIGIALPAVMALQVLPPPTGPAVAAAALMGYGLLWAAFGFVQLSRTP
jgi:hypothetical protein